MGLKTKKAVIIGAGIAGIASAIRLRSKGYEVEVYEANSYAGGKLSEFVTDGFRFDAGPSLFTMPQYVDELFVLAGKKPSAYFSYRKLDIVCRYFYEDGVRITAWADEDKFASEIENKTVDTAKSVKSFLKKSRNIYSITHHVFLERSLHKLSTYLRLPTLMSFLRMPAIDPFRTMNEANSSVFKDSKTVRFFNRYATYNGSDPYRAPATLNIIPHLEQHFGAWFPEGGMYSITKSLVKLAEDQGVKFHYNTLVQEIIVRDAQVRGVLVNDLVSEADLVISNMDVWFTYKKLLKDQLPPKRILKQERSSSALIFYWGIRHSFPELDLHNIFFSENYREEFKAIWQDGKVYEDPTVYVNISSKYNSADAPPGCENWFVMINVPSNAGQDWDSLIAEARKDIIAKLSRNLKADVQSLICTENILDPRSIESQTFSYCGSLYGSGSNNRFSAFLRHPNFTGKIKRLYFAGGSVHPGGGIPLALLSAKIAVNSIR